MSTYIVVCKFKPGTSEEEIAALVPAERAAATALQEKGLVGAVFLARSRDTVFIEVKAADQPEAERTIRELPMAVIWDLDFYPITMPLASPSP